MCVFAYACAIISGSVGSIVKIQLRERLKFESLWTDTNYEVAWFPLHNFKFAARVGTSSEVPDEPKLQYGVSVT